MTWLLSGMATAGQLTYEYSFDIPRVEQISIGGKNYHKIIMPKTPNGGDVGQPSLPALGTKILIPFGEKVEKVEVEGGEKVVIGNDYKICPVMQPVAYSDGTGAEPYLYVDNAVYGSETAIPDARFENIGMQKFRGYGILVLKLLPMEYIPASGELSYYPNLKVTVTTNESGSISPLFRGLQKDMDEVAGKVDNSSELISYPSYEKGNAEDYDLLILTLPWLESAFQPLKSYHDSTGVATEIYTILDVLNEVGNNFPDDVREFIRLKYLNNGIRYVLLGDDHNLIPSRYLYVGRHVYLPEDSLVTELMPADFYFGCLDGSFDFDGDGLYGEPTDGEDGGDVDLVAEVYVGRASVDDSTEAARFVSKTIGYLSSGNPHLKEVLICGEKTFFPGLMQFGKQSLVELIDGTDLHGYTTVGIPSDLYDINWLCAMDGKWYASDLMELIDGGMHVINHLGHTHYEIALQLWNSDLYQLTNEDHFLVYSQGCFAGGFDTLDCWAEYITTKIDGGAFAALMNARSGLGSLDDSDSPSQRYNREFWDAIFNPEENKPQIGRANHDSKEDNIYRINEGGMRWVFYEMNLFGDPTVPFKRFTGLAFDYPDGLPTLSTREQPETIRVDVSGSFGGTPISESGRLHYNINGGDLESIAMTELAPNQYEAVLPGLFCGDTLSYYFSAEETVSGRLYDPPPDSALKMIPIVRTMTAFEDDFETDKGWIVTDEMWQRGIPSGDGGEYGWPDPTEGCKGPNLFGYCLEGDYENDLPACHLTSPPINCTYLSNVHFLFSRWLGVGHPPGDSVSIDLSLNGIDWTTVWTNPGCYLDTLWNEMAFDISEYAAYQQTVYLRWTMGPTDWAARYCGWNIDNVRVVSYDCLGYYCGDANTDGMINVGDAVFVINYVFSGGSSPEPVEAGDANTDGGVNVADAVFLINHVFKGGPVPVCD